MKLVATFGDDGKATVQILDVPAKALVEARLQNTFNGNIDVFLKAADANGVCVVDTDKFGQNYAVSVRVLTDDNKSSMDTFIFDPSQSDDKKLTYVSNTDYMAATKSSGTPTPAAQSGITTTDTKDK